MRHLVLLILFSTASLYAQPELASGQTRLILSSAGADDPVGSPLIAMGAPIAWGVIAEANNPVTGAASPFFFNIDDAGQLTVLRPLSAMFNGGATGSVQATLTISLLDAAGMVNAMAETVLITVVEDVGGGQLPSVQAGQTRSVLGSAAIGEAVGDKLFATGTPTNWSITGVDNHADVVVAGVDQEERFFDINSMGELTVFQGLERFFPAMLNRAQQLFVRYEVTAYNDSGASIAATIDIYIVEGVVPMILGSQIRNVSTSHPAGNPVGDPIQALGDPTYWNITGGSPDLDNGAGGFNPGSAFSIDSGGQISTNLYLDNFFYVANPTTVTLTVVAGNTNGQSATVDVVVNIVVVGSARCATIPPEQTRFVSSIATVGDLAGFPVHSHGIDSMWIDAAWIGTTDVSTFFSIDNQGTTMGQISVLRDLSLVFDPEQIMLVTFKIVGHVFVEECPELYTRDVFLYVLPGDAGTGVDPDTGENDTDFSSYIDDTALLSCIQQSLGLTGSDPLTAAAVAGTTQLDCACRNNDAIADLDGLQLFSSLTQLNLSNNMIPDIRPVAGLTQLTDLRLAGNLITDVTTSNPLASLEQLVYLDLSQNQIRESNAFSTLSNIRFLSLNDNDICDIASLAALASQGPDTGINGGDTIHLDGNHLLNSGAQEDLAVIEAAGAFVSAFGNDATCPALRELITLPGWPTAVDVIDFAELLSLRPLCGEP